MHWQGQGAQALRVRRQGQRGGDEPGRLGCGRSGDARPPYDGHTLAGAIDQVVRVVREPKQIFVDRGYRGHNYTGAAQVHVDKVRRGRTPKRLWRWMKRRAAVEPTIGHLKQEHRMDRNRLKGTLGDNLNALLSGAGLNFKKLLAHAAVFFVCCCAGSNSPPKSANPKRIASNFQ